MLKARITSCGVGPDMLTACTQAMTSAVQERNGNIIFHAWLQCNKHAVGEGLS